MVAMVVRIFFFSLNLNLLLIQILLIRFLFIFIQGWGHRSKLNDYYEII